MGTITDTGQTLDKSSVCLSRVPILVHKAIKDKVIFKFLSYLEKNLNFIRFPFLFKHYRKIEKKECDYFLKQYMYIKFPMKTVSLCTKPCFQEN